LHFCEESLDLVAAEHWLELSRNQVGPCWEATNSALRAAGLLGDLAKAEKWAQEALEDGLLCLITVTPLKSAFSQLDT